MLPGWQAFAWHLPPASIEVEFCEHLYHTSWLILLAPNSAAQPLGPAPSPQVIPTNFQIRGMHTIIRDHTTHHADFVFYADRLLRLVRVHTAWGTVGLLWRVSPLQSLRARRGHPQ